MATFDTALVADPVTFQRAANASITVYDVNDTTNSTPLTLTDLNGLPLTNPLTSTADAFVPAFDTGASGPKQVKLVGGGLVVTVASYQALADEATAAKTFVQGIGVAATNTGAPGSSAAVTMDSSGQMTFTVPQGVQGPQGIPGVNGVANDTATAGYVNDTTPSATRGALDALYLKQSDATATYLPLSQKAANSGVASLDSSGVVAQPPKLHAPRHANGGADPLYLPVNAKLDFGAKGDGVTDDTTALQNFVTYCILNSRRGFIPAGTYKVTATINFSYRPQWVIRGAGVGVTVIKQFTDNIAIFNLGSDTASLMHSFELSNMSFQYNTTLQTGNTSANPILVSKMIYEGKISDMGFDGGYYAIRVASGIGGPWGMTFDNLRFGSNLTGGAMDWSLAVNAVPNNRFGRMFVTGTNMTGSPSLAIFDVRGYNFVVDTIEFIDVQGSKTLFRMAAGGRVTIGTMKLENGTYNTANSVFLLDFGAGAGCWASIGHFTLGGNNMVITNNTTVYAIRNSSEGVECDFMDLGTTAAIPSGSSLYAVSSSQFVSLGNVKSSNGFWTGLTNNSSSVSANFVRVRSQINDRLSDNKGDADYTVALGDPNIISYETALTAPRVINLPSDNTKLFNGLYYEVRVSGGAPTATNTLTVKNGSTTLATITADKLVYRWTWRRVASGNGWVLTKYHALP